MEMGGDSVSVIVRKSRGWVLENNVMVYKTYGRETRVLNVESNTPFLVLRSNVERKLKLRNTSFCLRYAVPNCEELVGFDEDDDVVNMYRFARSELPKMITLYAEVTDGVGNNEHVIQTPIVGVHDSTRRGTSSTRYDPHEALCVGGVNLDLNLSTPPQHVGGNMPRGLMGNYDQGHWQGFGTNAWLERGFNTGMGIPTEQHFREEIKQEYQFFPDNPQQQQWGNQAEGVQGFQPDMRLTGAHHGMHGDDGVEASSDHVLVHDESIKLVGEIDESNLKCNLSLGSDSLEDSDRDDEGTGDCSRGPHAKSKDAKGKGKLPYREGVDYVGGIEPMPDQETTNLDGGHTEAARTKWIYVNQLFNSKKDLQVALGRKCLDECFEMSRYKSDKDRLLVECQEIGCKWRMRATRKGDGGIFQVRIFFDEHTCRRKDVTARSKHATPLVLGDIVKDLMAEQKRVYTGKDIMQDLSRFHKINVTYAQAWAAKMYALELLNGTPEESFRLLPAYFHNLKIHNPGTITAIDRDEKNHFVKCFVSYGFAVRTFLRHCRKVVALDGAHLKGKYLGTMFVAVAMDGQQKLVPIAVGFGTSESTECWTWFLSMLKVLIGDMAYGSFISDRASSIATAVERIFPEAFHGSCCWHIWMNVKTKCNKFDDVIRALYWKTCKAYSETEFENRLAHFAALKPRAVQYLSTIEREKWTRAFFPGMQYNVMISNCCESLNSVTRHARKMPIVKLLDFVRNTIQHWYLGRREKGDKLAGEGKLITKWAAAKIAKKRGKCARWKALPIKGFRFQVIDGLYDAVVDLETRTCTCRKWDLSGIPCPHVIAAINSMGKGDPETLVADWYTINTYQNAYRDVVNPVGPPSTWVVPYNGYTLEPPVMGKRQAGRPPNKDRFPSTGEFPRSRRCRHCKRYGHGKSQCPYNKTQEPSEYPSQGGECNPTYTPVSTDFTSHGRVRSPPSGPVDGVFSYEGLPVPNFWETFRGS